MKIAILLFATAAFAADEHFESTESKYFQGVNLVILDNVNGSIEATGVPGTQLTVSFTRTIQGETPERLEAAKREVKVAMHQSGETVKLYVDGPFRGEHQRHNGYSVKYDFQLKVPAIARVDLYTVNQGQVTVRGITGGFDVRNVNGGIEMSGLAGAGKAHTVNGPVKAAFTRNPAEPVSFETINGPVDISFRRGLSADVRMETMHGELFTDYEVTALAAKPEKPDTRNGKFVYRRGGNTAVRIGSGNTQVHLKTLNGDIFVRDGDKK